MTQIRSIAKKQSDDDEYPVQFIWTVETEFGPVTVTRCRTTADDGGEWHLRASSVSFGDPGDPLSKAWNEALKFLVDADWPLKV